LKEEMPLKEVTLMKVHHAVRSQAIAVFGLLFSVSITHAALTLAVSPSSASPTVAVTATGSGFNAQEAVDVYFDTSDLSLGATSATGAFSCTLKVPSIAAPGTHWITAIGRRSGLAVQKSLTVRTNWAQFHNGHVHRGYNLYENVLSPSSVYGLDEAWTYPTGGAISSSPAVVNGVVYVGSDDGKLYALNAATGALKWSYPMGDGISSPTVAEGVVYATSCHTRPEQSTTESCTPLTRPRGSSNGAIHTYIALTTPPSPTGSSM
jgi:hypothetical protein